MALPIFAITIFVSAFLLFLVQPLVGKLILPKLGGTPQVWNTCMVFFQSALLAGYGYTHFFSTRLKLRQQLMLHGILLIVPVGMMLTFPIYSMVQAWNPPTDANPITDTLILLAIIVGVPFLVVSTSAPLLQRWFAYSGHNTANDPYFLYAASNIGSLLSLAVYPLLIEPNTYLQNQANIWFAGYVILAGLILACAYNIYTTAPSDEQIASTEAAAAAAAAAPRPEAPPAPAPAPVPAVETAVKAGPGPGGVRGAQRKKGAKLPGPGARTDETRPADDVVVGPNPQEAPVTWGRRIRWILLAAVPSSLMLGVTSFVSTDLSPFPLVWVIPLGLYLLSFVIVYTKWPMYRTANPTFDWTGKGIVAFSDRPLTFHEMVLYVLQPIGLIALCFIILRRGFDPFYVTGLTMAGFFMTALAAHGELAKDRPSTRHLTEYFLLMSVGGMLGGFFNGIFAPIMFQTGVYEFHVAIVVACLVRPTYVPSGWFDDLILNAFPGFQSWTRNQGDEMAKSMGRPAPRSTYLFNYTIDIIFGLFVLSIAWWLREKFSIVDRETGRSLWTINILKFTGLGGGSYNFIFNAFMLGIPMVFIFFFAGRPLRFGLAMAALLASMFIAEQDDRVIEARRTYFGLLRVMRGVEQPSNSEEARNFVSMPIPGAEGRAPHYPFTYLMHGTTYHGRNYLNPKSIESTDQLNKFRVDLTRLATTYYHRYGPVGVVMERDNWLAGPQNTFWADVKMPTMIIGNITSSIGMTMIPTSVFTDVWSEPAFATIGLGSGTMVSYARPYQHMTYYEIDEVIREFSLPMPAEEGGDIPEGRFTYLQNAVRRGVNAEVIMGDARLSLEPRREKDNIANSFVYFVPDYTKKARAYTFKHPEPKSNTAPREHYYRVINVDAFSSDAIPVHLVTKQAIEIYMSKLTQDGVLCVHTSNRHMDLVRPVARIALELSKEAKKWGEALAEGNFSSPEAKAKVLAEARLRDVKLTPDGKFASAEEEERFQKELFRGQVTMKGVKLGADGTLSAEEKEKFLKGFEINCLVGKDGAEKEGFMGHFSSEYVMIFRGEGFAKYVEKLKTERDAIPEGGAPKQGQQILNSQVIWYNPYTSHQTFKQGRMVPDPITAKDSLWTDDYSYILGVLR